MKASYRLTDPDSAEATLTITMRLGEWRKIAEMLPQEWPGWQLAGAINRMLLDAQKHFSASGEAS